MRTFQQQRVVPRENWLPMKVSKAIKRGDTLKVVIAADSPELFYGTEYDGFKMAKRVARRNGYLKFSHSTKTQVFGQNAMSLKDYYFRK